MAPKSLIDSIAMSDNYSFELISIETCAPKFIGHDKFFLGSELIHIYILKFCKFADVIIGPYD